MAVVVLSPLHHVSLSPYHMQAWDVASVLLFVLSVCFIVVVVVLVAVVLVVVVVVVILVTSVLLSLRVP